jgi:hypothetical protein
LTDLTSSSDNNNPLDTNTPSTATNTSPDPFTHDTSPELIHNTSPSHSTTDLSIRRPTRTKHKPSYLSDYVCSTSSSKANLYSSGTLYPIDSYHSFDHLSDSHSVYTLSLTQHTEPNTYAEACKSEHWIQAMNSELDALAKTGTWKIVDLPPNIKHIGSKWV